MNFYFVRHGESALNALRIHQDHTAPLSDAGKQHAASHAKRLQNISIDRIISSPFLRTKDTADIISSAINVPVETSLLFTEVKRPTAIEGKKMDDPEVVKIKKMIEDRYDDPAYRHSDEETFALFSGRVKQSMEYLNTLQDENILIVTHADFIKMFLAVVLFGERLQPWMFLALKPHLDMSHTGITHFKKEDGKWRLEEWNSL